jgi:hypothetical protein
MNCQKTQLNSASAGKMLEVSATQEVQTIAQQFLARGAVKAIALQNAEQVQKESQTRQIAPGAYRLSSMSDAAVSGCYRHGKENMSGSDLIQYFNETRAIRTKGEDFSEVVADDESVFLGDADKPCVAVIKHEEKKTVKEKLAALPAQVKQLPKTTVEYIRASLPAWFDFSPVDTTQGTRRFPLSAFAAIVAVAVSLMLIVASSVMIHHGEKRVSQLTVEVNELAGEVSDLKSELDVKNDLLVIRNIATEEFGMIEEKYVKMQYLSMGSSDSIEVFEEKKQENVGISAILSAIGLK